MKVNQYRAELDEAMNHHVLDYDDEVKPAGVESVQTNARGLNKNSVIIPVKELVKVLGYVDNITAVGIENVKRVVMLNEILTNQPFSKDSNSIACKKEDLEQAYLILNNMHMKGAENCRNLLWIYSLFSEWLSLANLRNAQQTTKDKVEKVDSVQIWQEGEDLATGQRENTSDIATCKICTSSE